MLELLSDLRIEQWSLIPIKRDDRGFAARSLDEQLVALRVFQKALAARGNIGPKIIGPGAELLGRSSTEQEALWATGRNMTPNGVCNLVDIVRYYTPKDGLVYPCNCVPHREGQSKTSEVATPRSFSEQGLVEVRDWLKQYGPTTCTGCEPANVALGEESLHRGVATAGVDRAPAGCRWRRGRRPLRRLGWCLLQAAAVPGDRRGSRTARPRR